MRYMLIPLGGKCDLPPPPNLRALTEGTRLILPNYLDMVNRFTGAPHLSAPPIS
jgi:hypothetical protein